MNGLVSIIVPIYRAEVYIADTIAMVVRQTYTEWELLLIDDCSPDGSVQVVRDTLREYKWSRQSSRKQDEKETESEEARSVKNEGIRTVEEYIDDKGRRILLISKEHNEGAAAARNTGLDVAGGRYIAFLDADDVWFPEKLEKELLFMRDRQAGFVFTAYEFGDEQANPTGKVVHVPAQLCYGQALSRTVIFTTTVLLDRESIPDKLIRMPAIESEDTATWWQILRAGNTAYGLDEVLAIYRRPARSLSSNKLTAIRRIWNLYRRQEKLSVITSVRCFIPWAYRACMRRL
ncbi:MAG: glycosyltransferase family 2 protein [Lachnospiraceae bacterium]|nr:glycosyltransferase family 2 protein [Lachnospiraceae bacterium]